MRFAAVCAYIGMALVFILPRYDNMQFGWADYLALGLFIPFLAWVLSSRIDGLVDADSHQDPRQLVSFRLGKALNRVRRRLSGRA